MRCKFSEQLSEKMGTLSSLNPGGNVIRELRYENAEISFQKRFIAEISFHLSNSGYHLASLQRRRRARLVPGHCTRSSEITPPSLPSGEIRSPD